MNDPRQGKPSASGVEMLYLCPGSAQAQAGLPELPDTEERKAGVRIHAALAGELAITELDSSEMATYEDMDRNSRKLAANNGFDPDRFIAEKRLWFEDEFSGQPDRVFRKGGKAHVQDFKAGFLPVTESESNPQLAVLAVLAICTYSVAEVEVAIIPRFGAVRETATYDLATATSALGLIRTIISESKKPDAPRRAGAKQCKYCRAKMTCPEYQAFTAVVMATPKAAVATIPNERLAEFIDRIPAVLDLCEALKAEGKARVLSGNEEFKKLFEISGGRTLRTIANLFGLFQTLQLTAGVTDEEFTRACKIDIGAVDKDGNGTGLKGVIHARTGLKGTALDDYTDKILKGFVVERKSEGSLKRIKNKK